MININELSIDTAEKIKNVLKIVLDAYELQPFGTENFFAPVKEFSQIGLDHTRTIDIINKIDKEENGALKYKGLENVLKYGHTKISNRALRQQYLQEHPLAIKNLNKIKQLYERITEKINTFESPLANFSSLSNQDIENLEKILDVISFHLRNRQPPFIIYIPYIDFPKEIQRFDINRLLKLCEDYKAIVLKIPVGEKPEEKEVDIRIDNDKRKFNEFKMIIEKKAQQRNSRHSKIKKNQKKEIEKNLICIKRIAFDKDSKVLGINNNEVLISFRFKQNKEDTKQFLVFSYLWDYKTTKKSGNIVKSGSFIPLLDLKQHSDCLSDPATSKQIERLNQKFKEKRLPIEIMRDNGKYNLIIDKSQNLTDSFYTIFRHKKKN